MTDTLSSSKSASPISLNNCESEPIHIPGAIQPHGALLAFETGTGSVLHYSNNLQEFFGKKVPTVSGFSLNGVVGDSGYQAFLQALATRSGVGVRHQVVDLPARPSEGQPSDLEALVHTHRGICFVEFFRAHQSTHLQDWLQAFDDTMDALRSAQELEDMLERTAHRVKRLCRFDRVMVYRFDDAWNGQVVAEAVASEFEPFFGLHYPASDIPSQARELYRNNLVRYIADVNYEPVPVTPLRNTQTNQPLDQSYASLRSISPMHIKYLQNMGVASTLVISIMVKDKLWGLIACHHHSPTLLPIRLQRACYSLAITIGYMISSLEERVKSELQAANAASQRLVIDAFNQIQGKFEDIIEASAAPLLKIAQATAGIFWNGKDVYPFGRWRSGPMGLALIEHAQRQLHSQKTDVFFTDHLQLDIELPEREKRQACGLAAIRLNVFNDAGFLWIRPEYQQEVYWAGNPEKAVQQTASAEGGLYLTPRASFERWQVLVADHSRPWSVSDQAGISSLGSLWDVLNVRDALQQVSTSDARFRSLLALQSDAYWQTNSQGELAVLSKSLGLVEDVYEGVVFLEFMHRHADAESYQGLVGAFANGREFRDLPLTFKLKDGVQLEFVLHGEAIRDGEGKTAGWHGTFTNVTERKASERQLISQDRFLTTLAHSIPGMVAYWDSQQICRFSNAGYQNWFAKSAQEMDGISTLALLGPELYSLNRSYIDAALSGEVVKYERSLIKPDGTTGHLIAQYIPDIKDNRVNGFTAVVTDVTAFKANQIALERLNAELVLKTNEALDAARSKGQFLANMSHEIRTPMNAILGLLDLVQNTELTDRQRDYIVKTHGAARSLLVLLDDILDFSKVEAGKMTLESEPFRIDEMFRNLSTIFSSNAGAKYIEVLFDIDSTLPISVRGDAMRLQQVLINLGGNAIKFTSKGQVVIALQKLSQSDETVNIKFAVQDTGIGIAKENLVNIFSDFSQAEGSTTRKFGGTGLGLAISKRFVSLMGGDIQIASEPGVGSTFSFTLEMPIVKEAAPFIEKAVLQRRDPLRVLVVDDNLIAGELTTRMVRHLGWTADLATSGEQAVAMVSTLATSGGSDFPYFLIYMDWKMPDMDGWETTRRIRQLANLRNLSQPLVIMLTAHSRDMLAHRTEAEQLMINGFLVKPTTASMLNDALSDARSGGTSIRKLAKGRSSSRQLTGMRILVVEDNLINQQIADELLTAQGAIVSLAANGRLGVEAVEAAVPQFDVVLMDIQMPVLDGYGATKIIREDLQLRELPIIAMTANALETDRKACLSAGMNEHVGKPFDMGRLVSLLIRTTGFETLETTLGNHQSSSTDLMPVPEVDGLDLTTALSRMSNLHTLYVRTARDFIKVMDTLIPELEHLLESGDSPKAVMILHTIKGNAGTLGANSFAECAAKLEKKFAGDKGIAHYQHELGKLHKLVLPTQTALQEAAKLLTPTPTVEESALGAGLCQGVNEETLVALRRMALLAKASDMEVLLDFAQARGQLSGLPEEALNALDFALQDLDLETAGTLFDKLLASFGSQDGLEGSNALVRLQVT